MSDVVVKIVPMVGPEGPTGPQGPIGPSGGPVGPQGPVGPGYAPVTLYPIAVGSTSDGLKIFGGETLPISWSEGSRVRVLPLNNGLPIPSIFMDGHIQVITPERDEIRIYVDYYEGTWGSVQYEEWQMVLTGQRGATGATGPQGIQGPKGDKGDQGIQGPIGQTGATGINWQGSWKFDVDYVNNDAVFYNQSSWFASGNPPLGEVPSLTSSYWFPLAIEGATGPVGPQGPIGLTGETGPQGPIGPEGILESPTPPTDTDTLWLDTSVEGLTGVGVQGEIGFPGFKYDTRRTYTNQYVVGEIIEYNGNYFICTASNDAIPPTGGAIGVYWSPYSFVGPQGPVGPQGDQGPQGVPGTDASGGVVYLGNYVSGNGYTKDIAVVRGSDNNLYIAKANGGLADPVGNTAEWNIFSNNDSETANLGDFQFTAATANVNNSQSLRLESRRYDGTSAGDLILNPNDPSIRLRANDLRSEYFNNQWSSATWSNEIVDIVDTPDIINFLNSITDSAGVQRVSINGGQPINVTGLSWTPTNVQLAVATPTENTTTITEIVFIYQITSQISLDYDDGSIDIFANRMNINMTTTEGRDINIISADDATLRASGDDLNLHAKDDIRFISSWDNADHSWTMDSEGRLQLPGNGYIENPEDSSGDGYQNDTIKIVPDSLLQSDQYLIIDPTAPNHIHIRAGGVQDYSNAELILGGERAGVHVSDPTGDVWVQTKKEDYNWSWQNVNPNDGTTYITNSSMSEPDIGDFTVQDGIKYIITSVSRDEPNGNTAYMATGSNGELLNFVSLAYYTFTRDNGNYTWKFDAINDAPVLVLPPEEPMITNLAVPGDITLSAYNGIKIAASQGFGIEFPDQTIQTTAYIPGGDAPAETLFTVNGGTTAAQPTFNGAPLFSGSYIKTGQLIHFQIQVDMDNISDFGTGQFYVDLPFAAKYGYQFKEGCLHDISTSKQYAIGGHVAANTERLFLTFTNSAGQDELFDHNSPITLNAEDNFHIAGTYITS
jgi:hypothetical protein